MFGKLKRLIQRQPAKSEKERASDDKKDAGSQRSVSTRSSKKSKSTETQGRGVAPAVKGEESEKSKTFRNQVSKVLNSLNVRKRLEEKKRKKEEDDAKLLVPRWVCKCLQFDYFPDEPGFNIVFAPIPTLAAYFAMLSAIPRDDREAPCKRFWFDNNCATALRHVLRDRPEIVSKTPNDRVYRLFRIVVDPDKEVLDTYMARLKHYLQQETVVSCPPADVSRLLLSLSCDVVQAPATGGCTGYALAGIQAEWSGKPLLTYRSTFAVTYRSRQRHAFFELSAKTRRHDAFGFEIWQVPMRANNVAYRLVLLRPQFVGEIHEARNHLLATHIRHALADVGKAEEREVKILLPVFEISTVEDVLLTWEKWGAPSLKTSTKPLPCLSAIWHQSTITCGPQGIGFARQETASSEKSASGKTTKPPKTTYAARFDSPFIFMITKETEDEPLLVGCYAGRPPPTTAHIYIDIPPRIRAKRSLTPSDWDDSSPRRRRRLSQIADRAPLDAGEKPPTALERRMARRRRKREILEKRENGNVIDDVSKSIKLRIIKSPKSVKNISSNRSQRSAGNNSEKSIKKSQRTRDEASKESRSTESTQSNASAAASESSVSRKVKSGWNKFKGLFARKKNNNTPK